MIHSDKSHCQAAQQLASLADMANHAAVTMVACSDAQRHATREPRAADLMDLRRTTVLRTRECLESLARRGQERWEPTAWRLAVELGDIPGALCDAAGLLLLRGEYGSPPGVAQLAHLVQEAVAALPALVRASADGLPPPPAALDVIKSANRHAQRVYNLRAMQVRTEERDPELAATTVEVMELLRHATDLAAAAADLAVAPPWETEPPVRDGVGLPALFAMLHEDPIYDAPTPA